MKLYTKLKSLFAAEKTISPDKSTHWFYLIVILIFLILPFFISYTSDRAGPPKIFSMELPSACLSHEIFNSPCPGCGLTRSFILITHGQIRKSCKLHRLGLLVYLFFILLAGYRIYCLRHPGKELHPVVAELQFILPFTLLCLLLINWCIGICINGGN